MAVDLKTAPGINAKPSEILLGHYRKLLETQRATRDGFGEGKHQQLMDPKERAGMMNYELQALLSEFRGNLVAFGWAEDVLRTESSMGYFGDVKVKA